MINDYYDKLNYIPNYNTRINYTIALKFNKGNEHPLINSF